MAIRRRLLTCLGNALAFVFTIGMGIIAGCLLSASEAVDEQLTGKKRHVAKQTRNQQ